MIGAILGDIAGSSYEFCRTNDYDFDMFPADAGFTDDSICTLAVAKAVLEQQPYGPTLHALCRRYLYPIGGYGGGFFQWIISDEPRPYNSMGNGSAMRVSPVGWAFDTREEVLEQARLSAECTHDHPDGIRGAQTTALAIFLARKMRKRGLKPTQENIRKEILEPCVEFSGYNIDIKEEDVKNVFGSCCYNTVPVALWIIGQSRDFEDAVRRAVSLGADADTLGDITGAIAEPIWGVPTDLAQKAHSYLTPELSEILDEFNARYCEK